jgi:Fe-S oxidoreductase
VNLATASGLLATIGLVRTPPLSGLNIARESARRGVATATPEALANLSDAERLMSVVVVQDAFTSYYDTPVLLALLDCLLAFGIRPWLAPYSPNGKPLHVHGFLGRFERLASKNAAALGSLAATGVAMVGLDPSMTLTYRSEYAHALAGTDVQLVQEWLADRVGSAPRSPERETYWLLPHCTERTTAQPAVADWSKVFEAFGLQLTTLPSGCCGMAGTYGHEAERREMSERIYGLSWSKHVADKAHTGRLLADGYSCRSQAKIIDGVRLPHPIEILRDHLSKAAAIGTVAERCATNA